MEEKYLQIEELLKEVLKKFEYRLRIKRTTLEHFQSELQQLENDYLEVYPNKAENSKIVFDDLLQDFKAKKEDNTYFDKDIPQLKALLQQTLNALDESYYSMFEEGNLVPNEEFKRLLSVGLITTETPINSKFKGKTISGFLTEEGFFEVIIDNKKISFSSLRAAAEHAWQKPMPNDCWNVWTANNKNGENFSMKHFRQILREQ